MKDLNVNYSSDKKLLLTKKLIQAHLDFYLYENECDYKLGVKTIEELRECSRTLHEMKSLVDFAFNKIHEEDSGITWDILDKALQEQEETLDRINAQIDNIQMSETKGGEKMDKIYVPIFDNGEWYEDNSTWAENVCFKSREQCIKWIEEQEEDGINYRYNENFDCWELFIEEEDEDNYDILYPDGFYTIHKMMLKD